ncbi:MAG: hypothetical protein LBS30_02080, partial [Planctomycetota bacterium]|nr:hypothetical protein [Planctomycetota bacterium]
LTFADVPWRDALRSVLRAHGGALEVDAGGDIVRVLARDEAPERLETLARPLRYLQPGTEQLNALLDVLKNIASEKGCAAYEGGTNSLILTDSPDKVAEMRRLVDAIDLAPFQVALETSIIDMDMNPNDLVGIDWLDPVDCGDGMSMATDSASTTMAGPPCAPYSQGTLSGAEAATVLRAALHSDSVSVAQAPQMTVLDREKAEVRVGSARPGEAFAGVRLAVTPRVCGDGDQVLLEICYEQHGAASPRDGAVRIIRTKMLLHSGETGIIAGLLADAPRGPARRFSRAPEKPSRRHSVILVTPILMTPPDDARFEQGVEALRESLSLSGH